MPLEVRKLNIAWHTIHGIPSARHGGGRCSRCVQTGSGHSPRTAHYSELSKPYQDCYISPSTLQLILSGVVTAIRPPGPVARAVSSWIGDHRHVPARNLSPQNETSQKDSLIASVRQWQSRLPSHCSECQLANLALGIAYLRARSRGATNQGREAKLGDIWDLVKSAQKLLQDVAIKRDGQGFLILPLYTYLNNGKVEETLRLHVWLPEHSRGPHERKPHAHNAFMQSWILAGAATNETWDINPRPQVESKGDKHASSSAENDLAAPIAPETVATHSFGMTYTLPAGAFHASNVKPRSFHASLCFFDYSQRDVHDSQMLARPDHLFFGRHDVAAEYVVSADMIASTDLVHRWDDMMLRAHTFAARSEWEFALRDYSNALQICNETKFPCKHHYRSLTLFEHGHTYRKFGRYSQAAAYLDRALEEESQWEGGELVDIDRARILGEQGSICRMSDDYAKAKKLFQEQFDLAEHLASGVETSRALGNLAMVNYQLARQSNDQSLLDLAISQLHQQIQQVRRLQRNTSTLVADPSPLGHQERRLRWCREKESSALESLSLCYAAKGETEKGVAVALQSRIITSQFDDPSVRARSRFYHGRALLRNGQQREALEEFSVHDSYTPAIAFCQEPSEEHRGYLRDLIDAGADLDVQNDKGYSALDYAVYNNDLVSQRLIVESLRQKFVDDDNVEQRVKQRMQESRLRKCYRQLVQDQMRPLLSADKSFQEIRRVYAEYLATDEDRRKMLDGLRLVSFDNFLSAGRLPAYTDGIAHITWDETIHHEGTSMLFISYRWIGSHLDGGKMPDDAHNTQYKRMLHAVKDFIGLHPHTDPRSLFLWIDWGCIDQQNSLPGVQALPLIIAQCNAVISLVDDVYYDRAWCCLEAAMIHTLRSSYHDHLWYEQVKRTTSAGSRWTLREAPSHFTISPSTKGLSYETDRDKIRFLERQMKLLEWA